MLGRSVAQWQGMTYQQDWVPAALLALTASLDGGQ